VYDGEQVAVLLRHTQALTESAKESLMSFANQNQLALFLQPAPETIEQITGKPLSYSETDAKIDFLPTDFIQVNETVNQKMVAQAIEWLEIKPTDSVLDLFCGLGNFSLAIAKKAQSVVGVEGIEAMVLRAQINAKHNGLDNIRFYQANLEESQTDAAWAKQRFDKVILDPARAGASGVLAQLTEFSPSRLVYISCNPATLARDSQQLAELGYELKQLGMLDMFPQTRHLESMALFVKSNKPVLRSSQHKTAVTKTAMSKTAGMSKTAAKKRQGTKRPAPKRLKI
ncbi:MAG: 23S rRNA (uracil(1939)-C(5))-methyltransferase RlmD, partial [Vibrio sp.]